MAGKVKSMLGKKESRLGDFLWRTDSYKVTHAPQYPPHTEAVSSYFESRRGAKWRDTVFFSLQYYLKHYLSGVVVTAEDIAEAEAAMLAHFGRPVFNASGWKTVVAKYGGKLPVSIMAVPEGTVVSESNVLMTIENTDPEMYWLTNWLETMLVEVWYGCTVATQSREMKRIILDYLRQTGDPGLIDFKLHDFGYRGVSSQESAAIGGAAHLVNFKGTDTMIALKMLRDYYGEPMAGFSIPAAEHSTITSWGRENEAFAFDNMLTQYPDGLVAVVSDSYDIENACETIWGTLLKDRVLGRNGTLVVRPDSGHPPTMVRKVLEILGAKLGYTVNEKGFKVLDSHVRVIQGDGVDIDMLGEVLAEMRHGQWSADNIAFGCGGALLQKLHRDTQRFAFKASAVKVSGKWHNVYKDPKSDPTKASKAGRLCLLRTPGNPGGWVTVSYDEPGIVAGQNQLVEVFRNGSLLEDQKLSDIRERARV